MMCKIIRYATINDILLILRIVVGIYFAFAWVSI